MHGIVYRLESPAESTAAGLRKAYKGFSSTAEGDP